MKNHVKILILLALVFCSVFDLSFNSVSAEDKSLSIEYCNLAFEDNVYIMYAVDNKGIDDVGKVKVLIFNEFQDEYVKGKEDYVLNYCETQVIGGKIIRFSFSTGYLQSR